MKHIVFDHDGTLVDTRGPEHKLFTGIKELLVELAREHQLYVWTARPRASTLRILTNLGVLQLFEGVCTIDDAPNKPHVAGLALLLGKAQKNSICMIGDSTNDILGAKNFGVLALGAVWGADGDRARHGDVLKDYGADFIVAHPSECSRIIAQNLEEDQDV